MKLVRRGICVVVLRFLGIDARPPHLALLQLALDFGLQLTQPSSELLRAAIFVDLLLSYNVVTLAVTSLLMRLQACS